MHVCENTGDHLAGNVYARYKSEEDAQKAIDALNSRWYAARPVYAELSPVTDFREADCRQRGEAKCNRGGMCNFMVMIPIPLSLPSFWHHKLIVACEKTESTVIEGAAAKSKSLSKEEKGGRRTKRYT